MDTQAGGVSCVSNGGARYAAFISYSSYDLTWAFWLHKALETYRVPRALVGTAGAHGPIPKRVYPIFRDRDELAASEDLGAAIREALDGSAHLIVICSPRASASRWVNEEIVVFRGLSGSRPISALVVDGQPGGSERSWFPPALSRGADLEPIAADPRPSGDGKLNGKLKIVASVLGIGFDQLKRRDDRRRRLRATLIGIGSFVLAAALLQGLLMLRSANELRNVAESERILGLARERLAEGYPDESIRLGLELSALPPSPSDAAGRHLLRDALHANHKVAEFVHPTEVSIALLPPRGDAVFTASGASAWLWSMKNGSQSALETPGGAITAASFDPAGKRLAVAFEDEPNDPNTFCYTCTRRVRIWDLESKTLLHELEPKGHVAQLAFDPDGARLVTTSQDSAQVWNAQTGETIGIARHGSEQGGVEMVFPVLWSSFSHDGNLLLTSGGDNETIIWNLVERRPVTHVKNVAAVTKSAFDSEARRVLMLTNAGKAVVWEPDKDTPPITLSSSDGTPIVDAYFFNDGYSVTTVSHERIDIWRADSGTYDRTMSLGISAAISALSPDGNFIAVGSGLDGGGEVWDLRSGRRAFSFRHRDRITHLDFSSDSALLVTSSRDGRAAIWNMRSRSENDALDVNGNVIGFSVVEGRELAVSWTSEGFEVWELATRERISRLPDPGRGGTWCTAEVSTNGSKLTTSCEAGGASVWDLASNSLVVEFSEQLESRVLESACDADCARLAIATAGEGVEVWDVAERKKIELIRNGDFYRGNVERASLSEDLGAALIWRAREGRLRLWRPETDEVEVVVDKFESSPVLAFDRDHSRFGAVLSPEELLVGSVTDPQKPIRLRLKPPAPIVRERRDTYGREMLLVQPNGDAIVYSDPGWLSDDEDRERIIRAALGKNRLATTTSSGVVRVWDLETGVLLTELSFDDYRYRTLVSFGATDDTLLIGLERSVVQYSLFEGDPAGLARYATASLPASYRLPD